MPLSHLTESLNDSQHRIERWIEQLGPDVSVLRILILLVLARGGADGVDQSVLLGLGGSGKTSISRTLRGMIVGTAGSQELIESQIHPVNRSRRVLRLTEKGTNVVKKVHEA